MHAARRSWRNSRAMPAMAIPVGRLVAQLAYEGSGGPELAYRFERFGE
jgi:hypothetical protein